MSVISRIIGLNNVIPRRLRNFMYLIILGTPSLERLLEIIEQEDETQWRELKEFLIFRTSNINVVASLALSTCASFLTTSGPTDILNWSHVFPYLCLIAGFFLAGLSVMSGLGLLVLAYTLQRNSINELRSNKLKFALTIILLTMPILCLSGCGLVAVVGCVSAAWFGDNIWARMGVTAGFAGFLSTGFVIVGSLY